MKTAAFRKYENARCAIDARPSNQAAQVLRAIGRNES
jgi:hypothetical protein